MKILLTALNAKYRHSAPSLFMLAAYADAYAKSVGHQLELHEFTINQKQEYVLRSVIDTAPQVVCFSCYIWNIRQVTELAYIIKQILPQIKIVLGGPEVSFAAEEILAKYPCIDIVVRREGEATLADLLTHSFVPAPFIQGISYRLPDGGLVSTPDRPPLRMDSLPFIYNAENIRYFEDKHIYYETSRGCPFSCGYCLSSAENGLRFMPLARVLSELDFFLAHGDIVKQVKLLDRTFNCRSSHAMPIWRYLIDNDNGITNFHFEIDANLLDEESVALLSLARRGQFQFEIGIQSTHKQTLDAISRKSDFEKSASFIKRLLQAGNIHLHLDLIAGLPYEDTASFGKSFDDVYGLKPQQLQLGFLKVLKGTELHANAAEHGIVYKKDAPYEVLYTKKMSYDEISFLHIVEMLVETYYNAGQACYTLSYIERFFCSAFDMYSHFARFYLKNEFHKRDYSRLDQMHILYLFCKEHAYSDFELVSELIKLDMLLKDNVKNPPPWFKRIPIEGKQGKMMRREAFAFDNTHGASPVIIEFDYTNRDIITGYAKTLCDKTPILPEGLSL